MRNSVFIAVAISILGMLSGCVSASSSNLTYQEGVTFSKGKELDDLVKALNSQAVTKDEYEEIRRIIMKRPN
jgi:hypothetical protein